MSRMQMIKQQARYWAKEADRLQVLALVAAKQSAVWTERALSLSDQAFNSDPRFSWHFDLESGLHKAQTLNHILILDKQGKDWIWIIRDRSETHPIGAFIAGSIKPHDNEVDCIHELIAYYDQWIRWNPH